MSAGGHQRTIEQQSALRFVEQVEGSMERLGQLEVASLDCSDWADPTMPQSAQVSFAKLASFVIELERNGQAHLQHQLELHPKNGDLSCLRTFHHGTSAFHNWTWSFPGRNCMGQKPP